MLRVLLKLCKYYRFYTHQYFGDCFASQHTIFSHLTNQVITNSRMNARLMSFSLSVFHLETLSSFELFVGNAERGALELWADEKITGQQAAGRQEFGDAVAPVGP